MKMQLVASEYSKRNFREAIEILKKSGVGSVGVTGIEMK